MRKPKVGETLFIVDVGNRARNGGKQRECTVTKVGRKYFYVEISNYWKVPFHIETWWEKTEYTADFAVYESKEEWEAEKKFRECLNKLRQYFSPYTINITPDQVKQIIKILDIEDK